MNMQRARKRLHGNAMIWFLLTLATVLLLVIRYMVIQIIFNSDYTEQFSNQFVKNRILQSPRGTIYDRNENPLALSVTVNSVVADPAMLRRDGDKTPEEVADLLAPYLRISREEIINRLQEDTGFIWLDRLLDVPNSNAVEAVKKKEDMTYIRLE